MWHNIYLFILSTDLTMTQNILLISMRQRLLMCVTARCGSQLGTTTRR